MEQSWWISPLWIIAGASVLTLFLAILGWIGFTFKFGVWKGEVDTDRKNFKEFMARIEKRIDEIFVRLSSPGTVGSASPIQLTDIGEKVAAEINAQAWARDIYDSLADHVSDITEEFEIYEYAGDFVRTEFEPPDEFKRKMKAVAYAHGITVGQIDEVLVVVLRDEIARHKKR